MGGGTGEIGTAITARSQNGDMRVETVDCSVIEVPGDNAPACAVLIHQKVEREILDKKLGVVFERLLVERVQNGMAGAVRCCAGALRLTFAKIGGHAAKGALVNLACFCAREGHA